MPNKKITARKNRVIKGQPHQLAYINDAEQGLLMALGGTGEMVDGVPAFPPFADKDSLGRDKFGPDGKDKDGDGKSYSDYGISGGQATAMFNDATMAGMVKSEDVDKILDNSKLADKTGILPELQKRAKRAQQIQDLFMGNALMKSLGIGSKKTSFDDLATLIGMQGSYVDQSGKLFAPTGGSTMFGPSGLTQGLLGQVTYSGLPNEDYDGPFADLVKPYKDFNADGPEITPPVENPLTGQKVCPDGYVFDNDLQACRLDTGSGETDDDVTGNFGDDSLKYYRATMLDTPSQFDPNPDAYTAMNNAFIESFAYNPALYENKMDITGFKPTPMSGLLG